VILADDREPERIIQTLGSMGVEVERKRLEVGDYCVVNASVEVAVERKSVNDFESSIIDGRLFDQVHRLRRRYPLSFLCVIGPFNSWKERISKDAYIGGILSVALTAFEAFESLKGIVVPLRLESEEEFCLLLKNLDRKVSSGKLKVYPRIIRKAEVDDSIAMLTAIPGIGVEKAKKLLEKFGSIHAVVNASIADLKKVEGIGDKQARRIYYFVRGLRVK